MKRFSYRFECSIAFSAPVTGHSYHLRFLPCEEAFQHCEKERFLLEAELPGGSVMPVEARHSIDAFGGKVQSGAFLPAHIGLRISAEGEVLQTPYRIDGTAHGMYFAPTVLTSPSEKMLAFARTHAVHQSTASVTLQARAIADAVHEHMRYVPGATSVSTSAAQAFELRQGVCQDYAHITLALLRHAGIAARYVCGFLSGEGATHAWIEYFDSGSWLALDPTHGRTVEYGCIKVAHGRDSADCTVNRGVFTGKVSQQNSVSIKVEEL